VPPQARILYEVVRLRTFPGTGCPILYRAERNETFDIVGMAVAQGRPWYKLCCVDQGAGWARSDTLDILGSTAGVVELQTEPCGPPPITVADFDLCSQIDYEQLYLTSTSDQEGHAVAVSYPPEENRGCVAELEYRVSQWANFWIKLQGADWSHHSALVFDVRAEPALPGPSKLLRLKVEMKRADGREIDVWFVTKIDPGWRSVYIPFYAFVDPLPGTEPLSALTLMEQLVFTVEAEAPGPDQRGKLYLDDIRVE
jgi:hypothetical protein